MNIGILVLTTLKYKQFFPQLLEGIKKHFLLDHKIKVFLFTDEFIPCEFNERVKVEQHPIPPYKYPEITLFRYKIFAQHRLILSDMDYLFYLDVDMSVFGNVGDEILNEGLMAVAHPGFFNKKDGWGDTNNPETSTSFLPKEKRKRYACGGTQGGDSTSYIIACILLSLNIDEDETNGVRAEWADETHWNHLLHTTDMKINEFSPSYCMPEPEHLVNAWGLQDLPKIILALDKNHKEIRE